MLFFFFTFQSLEASNSWNFVSPINLTIGRNVIKLTKNQQLSFENFPTQSLVLFPDLSKNVKVSVFLNRNLYAILTNEKHIGFHFGVNSGDLSILSSEENEIDFVFYYLKQPQKTHEYYLSTIPNDIFVIGNPPDKFKIAKDREKQYISFWHVTGNPTELVTSSLNAYDTDIVNFFYDNQKSYSVKQKEEIQINAKQFSYFSCISNVMNSKRAFKIVAHGDKSEFLPTRYQFNKHSTSSIIFPYAAYGYFKRKAVVPLTPLKESDRIIDVSFETSQIIIFSLMICVVCVLLGVIIGFGCAPTQIIIKKAFQQQNDEEELLQRESE